MAKAWEFFDGWGELVIPTYMSNAKVLHTRCNFHMVFLFAGTRGAYEILGDGEISPRLKIGDPHLDIDCIELFNFKIYFYNYIFKNINKGIQILDIAK